MVFASVSCQHFVSQSVLVLVLAAAAAAAAAAAVLDWCCCCFIECHNCCSCCISQVYDAPLKLRMQQMRFVSSSLKATELKTYVPKILMESQLFFNAWGESGEVNLLEKLSELTILTASRCLMGKEIRESMFDKVAQLYADMDAGITPLAVFYPTAPTAAHRKRNAARAEMGRLFTSVIQKRRETGERVRVSWLSDCLVVWFVVVLLL